MMSLPCEASKVFDELCAVAIPVYKKPSQSEAFSLVISRRVLPGYKHYLVMPESLLFFSSDYQVIRLPDSHFASIKAYGALMVDPAFYRLFVDFEFVLIHQLDCLLFSDRLDSFCRLDFDYIAPMILGRDDGFWPDRDIVGVGGFSLRHVQSSLRVLRLLHQPEFQDESRSLDGRILRNGAEDMFWSLSASTVDPGFTVAPAEVALAFGFEGNPRASHRRADLQQPFGCHHWNRLSYFLWYLRWISLPLWLWLRYIPPVLVELSFLEVCDQFSRLRRRIALGNFPAICPAFRRCNHN